MNNLEKKENIHASKNERESFLKNGLGNGGTDVNNNTVSIIEQFHLIEFIVTLVIRN